MLNYIIRLFTGAKFVLYEVSRLTWGVPVYAFNWIRCAPPPFFGGKGLRRGWKDGKGNKIDFINTEKSQILST